MNKRTETNARPESEVPSAPVPGSDTAVNTITAPKYGYRGIDMMALLGAVMERYEDIPENEKHAGLQWFFSKYGKGEIRPGNMR